MQRRVNHARYVFLSRRLLTTFLPDCGSHFRFGHAPSKLLDLHTFGHHGEYNPSDICIKGSIMKLQIAIMVLSKVRVCLMIELDGQNVRVLFVLLDFVEEIFERRSVVLNVFS